MVEFKCTGIRSDTPDVASSRRTFLGSMIGAAVLPSVPGPPVRPGRWLPVPAPRVPVAGAVLRPHGEGLALIGGFTERLESTASVQWRDPRRGWLPVGCSLLESRAEPKVVDLDEERLLVIGGWTGRIPGDRTPVESIEVCEPRRPDRRRMTPPPFGDAGRPLEGLAAIRLDDGRVLVQLDDELAIYDSTTDTWRVAGRIRHARKGAAIILVETGVSSSPRIPILVGGQESGAPFVEAIHDLDTTPRTSAWRGGEDADVPRLRDASITTISNGRVLAAGGLAGGRSTSSTWIVDPANRTFDAGPSLPLDDGMVGSTLVPRGRQVVVLGGESRTAEGPRPIDGLVIDPVGGRVARLPASPHPAVRTAVARVPEGLLAIGGYRFDPSVSVGRRTSVLDTADLLELPSTIVAD